MNNNESITCEYSIIILLEDECGEFAKFITSIDRLFQNYGKSYEIIIIANGKEGLLRNEMSKLPIDDGKLKAFSLNKKSPQAVCLNIAFKESCGKIIVACGSYQQLKENELIKLVNSLDQNTDIISPWRINRVDPRFNQFQSRFFNKLTQKIIGTDFHDLSCTVKIFRRKVLEEIELYGNMYRFLPVIAKENGFHSIEIPCEHYQEHGKSGLYSITEYSSRVIDILTIFFNLRFVKKPLRFFSLLGTASISVGFLALIYVFFQKIFFSYPIGGRSVLLLALLCIVLGIQIAGTGLLGEIIAFSYGRVRKQYKIDEII